MDELSMGYFECLKKSLHISARSMTHNSGFDLNEEFLINRLTTYSHAEKFKSLSRDENFLALLISSVKKGEVGEARVHEGISPGLVFQVAAATYIPIFKSSLLDNFKRGAILMYIAH